MARTVYTLTKWRCSGEILDRLYLSLRAHFAKELYWIKGFDLGIVVSKSATVRVYSIAKTEEVVIPAYETSGLPDNSEVDVGLVFGIARKGEDGPYVSDEFGDVDKALHVSTHTLVGKSRKLPADVWPGQY